MKYSLSHAEAEDVGNETDGRNRRRLVRDVRSSLNENNYERVNVSSAVKFKDIMQKKTRSDPGKSITLSV